MHEVERFDVAERVAASKARLEDRLSELSRRVGGVREGLKPSQVLQRPWVIFGLSAAVGYWLGHRPPRRPLLPERVDAASAAPIAAPAAPRESFVATALKQLSLTALTVIARRALVKYGQGSDEP